MDHEKQKRYQSLRVIISEAIMVVAVIIMVIVLAFVASGYWLNADFKAERQGLLQIYSVPTGADVDIDGESSWLQRTNTSKILASGKHTVTLSKEGYDSWRKDINITEGLLYRLHYPRLFLLNRVTEEVLDTTGSTFATASPDCDTLVLSNGTTNWRIIDLRNDVVDPKNLDISNYFSSISVAQGAKTGLFDGKILDASWSSDGNRVLFKNDTGNSVEWILIDVNNIKNSINLSRDFGADFTDIKILDSSANTLLAVQNNNLHKISVYDKAVSSILVENIVDFDYYRNEIIFSSVNNDKKYVVGLIENGDNKIIDLKTFDEPVKVIIFKFYDDTYLGVIENNIINLYKKTKLDEFSSFELSFSPEEVKVGRDGEFILMHDGLSFATLDMEANSVREWNMDGNEFGFIDNNMVYSVADGELIVYDFDGLNRRQLSKNVSDHFPVVITNDKWLYYFSDDNLIREWLIEK